MTARTPPDVDRLARSMLMLHGDHDDMTTTAADNGGSGGSWSKAPDFAADPSVPPPCARRPSATASAT